MLTAMGQNQDHKALVRRYQGGKEQLNVSLCPCTSSVGTWTQTQAETMKNMKERKHVPAGHQNAPPCFLTIAPDAAGHYQSLPYPAGLASAALGGCTLLHSWQWLFHPGCHPRGCHCRPLAHAQVKAKGEDRKKKSQRQVIEKGHQLAL